MDHDHLHVITGPPGSGKTPIVNELVSMGFVGVAEPAREVIAEHRQTGRYEEDRMGFCEDMLALAIRDHECFRGHDSPVFFDRGTADLVAYARGFDLDATRFERAAAERRYADRVFFTPSWREIYTTDEERTASFELAHEFGELIGAVYVELGYTLVEVPRDTPEARARFIADSIAG